AVGDANRDGIPDLVSGGNNLNLFFPMRFGTNSWQSSIVTPFQNLAAPSNLSVTNGDRNATINFQKSPDYPDESGSTITAKYQYHLDGILLPAFTSQPSSPPSGPYVVTQPGSTSATVYGIVNGTNYTLKIRGNYDSIYNYTTQSLPITLSPTAVPPVPGGPAPQLTPASNVTNTAADVNFTQASGTPTGYEYNLNNTGWFSASSSTSPLTFTGLTAGTSYTVRLRAVYSVSGGANPYSDASNEITFTTRSGPLAPTNLVATPGVGSATIAFTVPADGGSPITNYEYKVGNGAWTALNPASTTSPVTITGLTGGSALSIQLRGVNIYGGGTASTAVT
ncbi:MAG: fibronectin type III domain-containing protein, partial [Planctomycetia bacterium]